MRPSTQSRSPEFWGWARPAALSRRQDTQPWDAGFWTRTLWEIRRQMDSSVCSSLPAPQVKPRCSSLPAPRTTPPSRSTRSDSGPGAQRASRSSESWCVSGPTTPPATSLCTTLLLQAPQHGQAGAAESHVYSRPSRSSTRLGAQRAPASRPQLAAQSSSRIPSPGMPARGDGRGAPPGRRHRRAPRYPALGCRLEVRVERQLMASGAACR